MKRMIEVAAKDRTKRQRVAATYARPIRRSSSYTSARRLDRQTCRRRWHDQRARLEGTAEVQVSVRDTGIGNVPEDQAKVFDEFQQVGKSSDRSREGQPASG